MCVYCVVVGLPVPPGRALSFWVLNGVLLSPDKTRAKMEGVCLLLFNKQNPCLFFGFFYETIKRELKKRLIV